MSLEEHQTSAPSRTLIEIAADIVSAYVSNNALPTGEMPNFISAIYGTFTSLQEEATTPAAKPAQPAVPVKKSVGRDFIICLEDGKKFKSLRRHLSSVYNMTPEAYRAKWSLPRDYPMVAPSYAAVRSELAKKSGLGKLRTAAKRVAAVTVKSSAKAGRRGQSRKAA